MGKEGNDWDFNINHTINMGTITVSTAPSFADSIIHEFYLAS